MNIYFKGYLQYLVFIYLSSIITLFVLVLYYTEPSLFQRFFGDINPIFVVLITFILGSILLSYLITKTSFAIYRNHNLTNYLIIIGIAFLFGIEVIIADIWFADYSADINISFPQSILFYPVIGYIVDVFFHIIPISISIFILSVFTKININKIVWISIITVAIIEPLYQVWFTNQNSITTAVYTAIHVFLISLSQLWIFKRYDFISMYLFRMVYYFIWHILWGNLRLGLLFNY